MFYQILDILIIEKCLFYINIFNEAYEYIYVKPNEEKIRQEELNIDDYNKNQLWNNFKLEK